MRLPVLALALDVSMFVVRAVVVAAALVLFG